MYYIKISPMKKKHLKKISGFFGIINLKLKMILLLIVFSFSVSFVSAIDKITVKAGVSKVVISNKSPRIMVNKVTSDGIQHDIYARALVLNDGVKRMIFVTYDLNCLDVATPLLRKRVKDELGIDQSQLVLLGSHNHLAPLSSLPVNFDYGRELAGQLFNLIKDAIADERGPVSLNFGFGYGYFVRADSSSPTDYEIQVLKVIYKNKPIAVLYNQPTHPVRATTNKIDPSHPGYTMDELEKRYPGLLALYSDGCGGNQFSVNVANADNNNPLEKAKAYAHLVAQQVIKIMDGPMEDVTGPIQSKLERVSLPLAPPLPYVEVLELAMKFPKDLGFVPTGPDEATNGIRMAMEYYKKNLPFPKRTDEMICTFDAYLINKSDTGLLRKYSSSISKDYPNIFEEVIVSRIGKMAFVAMQGEVCAPIGMRIKDAFRRNMPIMVCAYMGEQNLYIPTRELVREKAYQGVVIQTQFASPVGWAPEVEDDMVNSVIKLTRSITGDIPSR
jgi:neutral ceramidase